MNISFQDYWENVSVFVKLDTELYRKWICHTVIPRCKVAGENKPEKQNPL